MSGNKKVTVEVTVTEYGTDTSLVQVKWQTENIAGFSKGQLVEILKMGIEQIKNSKPKEN